MITLNVKKVDKGDIGLLGNTHPELWYDERERLLTRVGTSKGFPEIGSKIYSITYETSSQWILRCIEIINSMDGRSRSNRTISISLPAGIIEKGKFIQDLFLQIDKDVKSDRKGPSDDLKKLMETPITERVQVPDMKPMSLFGVRYYNNETELLELFDNLYQKEYLQYETVYFIPKSGTRFHPDEKYVMISSPIDKIQSREFSNQMVCGIKFQPEPRKLSFFESDTSKQKILWRANGYKTIEKNIHDSQIKENDIYCQVAKSQLFTINPARAIITCLVNGQTQNCEDGYFYIPYNKIQLIKEKGNPKHIEICYYPTDLESRSLSDFVLCEQGLINHSSMMELTDILQQKLAILLLGLSIIIGSGIGAGVTYAIMRPKNVQQEKTVTEIPEETDNSPQDIPPESTNAEEQQMIEQQKVERYLAQDTWREYRCSEGTENEIGETKEPEGLWAAMRSYDYPKIQEIYKNLNDKGYECGSLKDIVSLIDSYGESIKTPSPYSTAESGIKLSTWKSNVCKENEKQLSKEKQSPSISQTTKDTQGSKSNGDNASSEIND